MIFYMQLTLLLNSLYLYPQILYREKNNSQWERSCRIKSKATNNVEKRDNFEYFLTLIEPILFLWKPNLKKKRNIFQTEIEIFAGLIFTVWFQNYKVNFCRIKKRLFWEHISWKTLFLINNCSITYKKFVKTT